MNINNLLWSNKVRHLNPTPKIVVKGKGKMLKGYANIIKNDWKTLNCSDKYLVKKIEIFPKLRSEDHRRVYGEAFPMENRIQISMTDSRNRILNKDDREKTLMHEIGHLKYYRLPDSEKDRIADEEEYSYGNENTNNSNFPRFYELMNMKRRVEGKRPKYIVVDRLTREVKYGPTSITRAQSFFNNTVDESNPFKMSKYVVEPTREY